MTAICVYGFAPQDVPRQWPLVAELLANGCTFDISARLTVAGLYDRCISGESVLLRISDGELLVGAAVITHCDIVHGKHLFVEVLGGRNARAWLPEFVRYLETAAKVNNCTDGILFSGRWGWSKVLDSLGFEVVAVTMRKGV